MTDFCEFMEWCGSTRKVTIESTLDGEENQILISFIAMNDDLKAWKKRTSTLPCYLSQAFARIKEECEEAGF